MNYRAVDSSRRAGPPISVDYGSRRDAMLLAQMLLPLVLAAGPSARGEDPYESALTAAVHHFVRQGQLEHLKAILDKHPRLVDALEPFPPGHKPYANEGYTPLDWAASKGHE